MNLNAIQEALELAQLSPEAAEQKVLEVLAEDEHAATTLSRMLDAHRKKHTTIAERMNVLLGKARIALERPKVNTEGFIQEEIDEFYATNGVYGNPFKNG